MGSSSEALSGHRRATGAAVGQLALSPIFGAVVSMLLASILRVTFKASGQLVLPATPLTDALGGIGLWVWILDKVPVLNQSSGLGVMLAIFANPVAIVSYTIVPGL